MVCLVHFAYAEHQELLKNTDEVNRTYQQLTTNLQTKLSALASRKEQATQRVGELIQERVQATRKSLQPSTDMAVAQELEARDPDDSQQADTNAGNVAHTAKRIKTDAAADNVEIASAVSPDNDSLLGDEDLSINDIPDPHKDSAHQADPEALPDFGTTPSLQDEIALGANGTLDLASYKRAVDKYQRQKLDRIETRFAERMDPLREQLNMAYIMQLRVVRRSQGSNACREVFNKIFQSDWTTYQTYVAHALIEFYMNKDVDKAALVFKHGMKRFDKSPAFILQYLEYLIRINDVQNAQALFELAVSGIPPEEAKDIWDTYLDYQNQYGDLEATHKLETRYRDAFPQETLTHRLATKYTFQDVAVVAQQDLGLDRLPDERQPTAAATAAAATEQPAVDDKPQGPVLPSKHETAKPHRSWDMPPRGEGRKRLFTSVEPGKYPRPDWSQWVSLRASEAAAVRSTGKNGAGDGGGEFSDDSFEDEGTGSPPASPPGSTTTVNKAGHPLHAKIEDDHHQPQPFQHRPPHHPRSRPGSVDPFSSNPHSPAPSTSMEDPSLALIHTFLKALPPAKAFDGPTFVADAILKRLTKANVPPINPDYSALAMGLKSQPQGRQHPSAGPSGGFMGGGSSAFAESSTSGGDAYHPEPYYDDPGDWRGPPAGDGNAAPPGHDWSRDRTDYREPYRDRRGRYPPSARPPLPPPQPLQQRDPGFRDRNYRGQPSYRARVSASLINSGTCE
ncbi:mRNA 3'-end-processing protein rna14 [Dimargaris verticillata]|uniref:mRNA 3'-end-processing protein rna14 n=1 Tax=Dimargaris verticillata TaxID=2761393 RepID=A0A9W8ED14_9FUNG|nr:mRNA 3'-end-processing protein rna14 [Dimargaris verticillata]